MPRVCPHEQERVTSVKNQRREPPSNPKNQFAFEQQLKKSSRTFEVFIAGCRKCVKVATEHVSQTIATFGLVDSDSDLVREIEESTGDWGNSLLARTELRDLEITLLSLDRQRTFLQIMERNGLAKPKKFVDHENFYMHIIQELSRIGAYRVANDIRYDAKKGHIKFEGINFASFVDVKSVRINKDELRKELKRNNSKILWTTDGWQDFEQDKRKWLNFARDNSAWHLFVRGHDFEEFMVNCLWDRKDDHSKRKSKEIVQNTLFDLRLLIWETTVGERIRSFLKQIDSAPG